MKSIIMKKRMVKYYWSVIGLILLGIGGGTSAGYAQVRPIIANLVITPPYTLALDDYTSPTSNKLNLLLLLRDANISGRRVRLRFTITNPNNVRVTTSDAFFLSQPGFVLNTGAPLMLSGADSRFRQFFELPNLNITMGGNDLNQFRQSKRLPSGVYTWQVEVFDYNRPQARLSNVNLSRQTIWMVLNQPPIVNIPQSNQKLRATNYGNQNVIFQWFNRSASSPNSAFSTEYNVFLYELYEPNGPATNPLTAPRNLVYQNALPLNNTTLIYNNTFPALTPGKRYIFQVQAQDREKRDLFENQGFSEAIVFQYGEECLPPANLRGKAVDFQTIRLDWDASPNQTRFVVRYRPAKSTATWEETTSQFNDITLKYLKKNTEYEYEIRSICGSLDNNNWISGRTKTLNQEESKDNFVCGVPKGTYDLSNQTPLDMLNEGDIVMAGGYPVTIRRATGGSGQFSGVGVTKVPVGRLKVKFKVGFKDIFINADKKMLRGNIYVVRNKWKAMEFAERVTVDEWRIQEDGRVQIKQNGGDWAYVSSGKDYMLVDAATQKKLFVDRNGKSDIPLEDRDYSNLTPKEILAEIKKLKEEADEAIQDGRWGDALKLADKATELAEKIGGDIKKVVGFGKVLLAVIEEMIEENKQTKDSLEQVLKNKLKAAEQIITKINKKADKSVSEPIDTTQDYGVKVIVEEGTMPQSTQDELMKDQNYKTLIEQVRQNQRAFERLKPISLGVAILEYYKKAENLAKLESRITKDFKELMQKYEAAVQKHSGIANKATREQKVKEEIASDLKGKIEQIRQTVLQNIQPKK